MSVKDLISEMKQLSPKERLKVIEAGIATFTQRQRRHFHLPLGEAALLMREEYINDKELTAFSEVDGDGFHEYTEEELNKYEASRNLVS